MTCVVAILSSHEKRHESLTDLFCEMLEILRGLDVSPLDVGAPEGVEHLHDHAGHLLQELLLYLLCNLNIG